MKKLQYHLVDVFTDQKFAGNQLAVITDGRTLTTDLMQKITKEFNFSETTFVLPPENAHNDFKVRIFTPAEELPMAGHPTIGTAFVLARQGMIDTSQQKKNVIFEEGVDPIPVNIEFKESQPSTIKMSQPLPSFGPQLDDRDSIARMLSIEENDILPDYPLEVVSCGVPFLFIPLRSIDAVKRARLQIAVWEDVLRDYIKTCPFIFSKETERKDSTVHCRMFAPGLNIMEDPATGSANGPLGCYLVQHGIIKCDRRVEIISEQGFEIGRPSILKIEIETENQQITGVVVGGECVYVGSGEIEL